MPILLVVQTAPPQPPNRGIMRKAGRPAVPGQVTTRTRRRGPRTDTSDGATP